jgi:hypothetical protein
VAAAAAGVLGCAFFGMHAVTAETPSDAAAKPETVESRSITVRIDRPFDNVYAFLADPVNWNQWLSDWARTFDARRMAGLPTPTGA